VYNTPMMRLITVGWMLLVITGLAGIVAGGGWLLGGLLTFCTSTPVSFYLIKKIRTDVVARRRRRERYDKYLNLLNDCYDDVLDLSNPHPQILCGLRWQAERLLELFKISERIQQDRFLHPVGGLVEKHVHLAKVAFWADAELVKEFRTDLVLPTTVDGFSKMNLG